MALTACPECKNEVSTMAATCPRCGAPVAHAAGGGVQSAGPGATLRAAGGRLKLHTAVAMAMVLASSVGLMAEASTTAAGPNVAAVVFGLLFVLAILYYVEVRVRSSRHRR